MAKSTGLKTFVSFPKVDISKRKYFISFYQGHDSYILNKNDNDRQVKPGSQLVLGDIVQTDQTSRAEIRDNFGAIFRLGHNSSISIEQSPEKRNIPVYDGSVFKLRKDFFNPVIFDCGGKYRTSCYSMCPTSEFIAHVAGVQNEDIYYSFSPNNVVWEYDEQGNKFEIVALKEGESAVIKYDDSAKKIVDRYQVIEKRRISDKEYDSITNDYLNDRKWRSL